MSAARRWKIFAVIASLLACGAVVAALTPPLLTSLRRARNARSLAACADNLRSVGMALKTTLAAHPGALPASPTVESPHTAFVQMLTPKLADPRVLFCPADASMPFTPESVQAGSIGYYYYVAERASTNPTLSDFLLNTLPYPRTLSSDSDPRSWVLSDRWFRGQPTVHDEYKKGLNYLSLDGHVEFISESPRKNFH